MKVFYKKHPSDLIYWVKDTEEIGRLEISFNGETILNLWTDYPWKFTRDQIKLFKKENPDWADFYQFRYENKTPKERK